MNKALLLLLVIFVIDLLTPFGVAIALLYTICILLVVSASRDKILIVGILASAFTIIKFLVYYSPQTEYYFIANRIIALVCVWVTVFIAIKFRLLEDRQKLITELAQKTKESEQFIYIASHDLNEPLRTVKSMTQLLEQRYGTQLGDDGKTLLNFIHSSNERMSALIHALLEYGRLGKNSVLKNIDCNVLIERVKQDLHLMISETSTVIKTRKLPIVKGYEIELRMLFQNLITNAIKFRKADVDAEISIMAESKEHEWRFSVSDNGIGMEKKHLEKIFTIFKKLHAREEFDGAGIGLAHCRKIVEMHHGKIYVESEPGKGSTFYFTIPIN